MAAQNLLGDLALETTQVDNRALLTQVRDALGPAATDESVSSITATLEGMKTASGRAMAVGNAKTKFRDGFASVGEQPDPGTWTLINDHPDTGNGQGHIVNQGGDANGSSYLRISMSPFVDNSSVWLTSKEKFRIPTKVGWGLSATQRIVGQELFFGVGEASDTDPTGINRVPSATPADVPITGTTGTVTSNALVVGLAAGHPFRTGDRVILVGCTDTRMNVGPVVINGASATDISVPLTIANGSYSTVGGAVRYADPVLRASNGFGLLLENATLTNASLVARRNGAKARVRNQTISTTAPTGNMANWSDAALTPSIHEQFLTMDECSFRSFVADGVAGMNGSDKFHQGIPDEELNYRLAVRARNLDDLSKPIARIVSVAKSGSNVATITTDRAHGLTTSSRVGINGIRDQTNFANNGDLAVASVPSTTTFTVAFGASATATDTNGGVVYLNHGLINVPGSLNFSIQSIDRINDVLRVTLNTTASGFSPGEYVHLWGMNGAGAAAYENAYKVMRQTGATIELWAPGPNFASITTGGSVIRRTDFRLHFVRVLDHTRHLVEVLGGRGNQNDGNNAVPVAISSGTTLTVNNYPRISVAEGAGLTSTNLGAGATYTMSGRDAGSTDATNRDTKVRVIVQHTAGTVHGHLTVEQSTDNSAWRVTGKMPIPSDGQHHTFEFPLMFRYWRLTFINGATAQTSFYLGYVSYKGDPAVEPTKNLPFPLTAAAGMALASAANTVSAVLDLGANHNWSLARLFASSDQASGASGIAVQQSMDGSTGWFNSAAATNVASGAGMAEERITCRYLRAIYLNGATAATTLRLNLSLVSL